MSDRAPEFGTLEYECSVVAGGLELLLTAIHADDPKREILVRVGDIMRDVKQLTAKAARSSERIEAANATIARVWKALGISTYEQAGGKEISEIVVERIAMPERLTRRIAALEMVIREELSPLSCDDEANRMLVEEIHK